MGDMADAAEDDFWAMVAEGMYCWRCHADLNNEECKCSKNRLNTLKELEALDGKEEKEKGI